MRIAKFGKNGGHHAIKQVTGSFLGGVWFYAEGRRGNVLRVYISWSEMDQINEAIRDAKEQAAQRGLVQREAARKETSRLARVNADREAAAILDRKND